MNCWRLEADGTYVAVEDHHNDALDILGLAYWLRANAFDICRAAERAIAESRRLRYLSRLHRQRAVSLRRVH
jgi:hypothetical protein